MELNNNDNNYDKKIRKYDITSYNYNNYNKYNKYNKINISNHIKNNKNNKKKISIGIACCRINGNIPEILLICKRCTYYYVEFVHGRYSDDIINNNSQLINLFNGMTVEEKIDILSLNFSQIWYRVWLDTAKKRTYFIAKTKFEFTFITPDGGAKLRKLISRSENSNRIWEIPKGRKKFQAEADINCAIREFEEETNIKKNSYKIFPKAKRTYSYINSGVEYINTYYISIVEHLFEPKICFDTNNQIDEICDIKWMSIEEIRIIDKTGRLAKFVSPIFKYIKKKIKSLNV